jgi:hypothetical protein
LSPPPGVATNDATGLAARGKHFDGLGDSAARRSVRDHLGGRA